MIFQFHQDELHADFCFIKMNFIQVLLQRELGTVSGTFLGSLLRSFYVLFIRQAVGFSIRRTVIALILMTFCGKYNSVRTALFVASDAHRALLFGLTSQLQLWGVPCLWCP